MEETFTSKLDRYTAKKGLDPFESPVRKDSETLFEDRLMDLLDQQLIVPRNELVDKILLFSKSL